MCRYSVKLLVDQASLGPVESLDELYTTLQDYHDNWFIGLVTDRSWQDSVAQEKPFLFSLGHDLTMVNTFTGIPNTLISSHEAIKRTSSEDI